jgi:hypothetical protein
MLLRALAKVFKPQHPHISDAALQVQGVGPQSLQVSTQVPCCRWGGAGANGMSTRVASASGVARLR